MGRLTRRAVVREAVTIVVLGSLVAGLWQGSKCGGSRGARNEKSYAQPSKIQPPKPLSKLAAAGLPEAA